MIMAFEPFFKYDWKAYKEYIRNISKVEEIVIKNHFDEVCKASSNIVEKSQPELDEAFTIFKEGWIMCTMFTK
jgi:hypothetical protein